MSESMWWLDEAWWEKKILPLGFITLSFRELATVSLSFVAAFLASLPFEFPIAGVSFGGRATVFCLIFGTGCTVSSRRVKLLPVEVQVLSLLRIQGIAKARAILQNFPRSRKKKQRSAPESNQPPIMQEMVVEDFKNPIPLVIFGRVKEVLEVRAGEGRAVPRGARLPLRVLRPRHGPRPQRREEPRGVAGSCPDTQNACGGRSPVGSG